MMQKSMKRAVSANASITFSNVTKHFGDLTVLDGLSLTLKETGVTAIMGPSGCGKTTLLSLIIGTDTPSSGEILNPHTEISVAFQDPRLLPWLTALENVKLVLSDLPQKEKNRVAADMLSALGLGDALKKRPAELSGGMQQRVSLARAFVAPHTLLVLDEPFRGLDDANKQTVTEMIRAFAKKRPVILVTHDPGDAVALDAAVITLSDQKNSSGN